MNTQEYLDGPRVTVVVEEFSYHPLAILHLVDVHAGDTFLITATSQSQTEPKPG